MAGKVNKRLLQKEIFNNKNVKKEIFRIVNKQVQKEKTLLISEFNQHPVTKEIEAGESASNISGTLGGYGNLFSFLGFQKGVNPVNIVKKMLLSIKLSDKVSNKNKSFSMTLFLPSKEELEAVTKLPWENGRSWLFDIEKSISGLGAYLYGKFVQSRSGGAIQVKDYSNKVFQPKSYFDKMYNKFIIKVTK